MTRTIHAARAGAVVLLATTLVACAARTAGRDFDDTYAQQIKPGETTKAEIRGRLGVPALVTATDDHAHDTWIYAYYSDGGAGAWFRNWWASAPTGQQQKRLIITFNGDRVAQARFIRELPQPNPLEQAYR
jgi:outer membrane protein assembly factor BamE (lipoprotein component of BamABCDE complex)